MTTETEIKAWHVFVTGCEYPSATSDLMGKTSARGTPIASENTHINAYIAVILYLGIDIEVRTVSKRLPRSYSQE